MRFLKTNWDVHVLFTLHGGHLFVKDVSKAPCKIDKLPLNGSFHGNGNCLLLVLFLLASSPDIMKRGIVTLNIATVSTGQCSNLLVLKADNLIID